MKTLLILLIFPCIASSQVYVQTWDALYKPTSNHPRFHVSTEKKDSLWHRKVYYAPEGTLAMTATYRDSAAILTQGNVTWYHTNGNIRTISHHNNGKRDGLTKSFTQTGLLTDSAHYINGSLTGIRLRWNEEGKRIDSMNFDGKGTGFTYSWREDGSLFATGKIIEDTLRIGTWTYFHPSGKKMAEVVYQRGEDEVTTCFGENGNTLIEDDCEEKSAEPRGGLKQFTNQYRIALQKALEQILKKNKNISAGVYTVYVKFSVDKDGTLGDFSTLTAFGYDLEKRAIEVIKSTSPWVAGRRFGQYEKSWMIQPVTYMIEEE